MFCLTEVFHHVINVTLNIDNEVRGQTLVLLLSIATKVRDISAKMDALGKSSKQSLTSSDKNMTTSFGTPSAGFSRKFVKNLINKMSSAVMSFPDSCEEKHMLVKKLCGID